MKNSKKKILSLRHGINLSKMMCPTTSEEVQHMSKILYASAIKSLMYAMLCTRPDIVLTIIVTSIYQSNPNEEYWIAMKNILKYLRRTKNLFLIFEKDSKLRVEGYTDSDFIFDADDRMSTSWCIIIQYIGRILINQSMKAEYAADV